MNDIRYNLVRIAFFFFLLGLLFGLETYLNYKFLNRLWPILLTNLGAGFIGIFFKRRKQEALYLAIGIYLILLSLLFLYCSFTNWSVMSWLWPAFIGFLGVTLLLLHLLYKYSEINLFLGLIFLSLCAVFILVFSISAKFWWTIFIFLGMSILALKGGAHEKSNSN